MSEVSPSPPRPATPVNDAVGQIPPARPYRFTWDSSSRRPGPESVSGTTEGRGGDYFNQPALTPFPLGALNTSSTNIALGTLPNEWSSSKHGFHAISTVLNNPHKKQAPPKAHSSLPAVAPVDLPRVRRKDFDSYLKAIAPEWERFEQNNRIGREGQAQLDSSALQSHDDDENITPRASMASDSNYPTSTLSVPPPPSSRTTYLTSSFAKTIPALENVPSIFFQQGFSLADPSTFAKVTEQPSESTPFSLSPSLASSTNGPATLDYITDPTSSLSYTPPLLDKFSHYADTVEQHLILEISLRSTSFFAALTNLQDLQSESDVCLDRIAKLRGLLKNVDQCTTQKGLNVVRKCREIERVQNLREAVRGVGHVVEMTRIAKGLVGAGQWGEALNMVEELEQMWIGNQAELVEDVRIDKGVGKKLEIMIEEAEGDTEMVNGVAEQSQKLTPGFPLSVLIAFSELPNHLRVLTLEIAASLSQELIVVLRHDLGERMGHGQGSGKANGHNPRGDNDEGLKDRLKPLLQDLVRTRGLKDAIFQWREMVLADVRRVAKEVVNGFDKDWDEDKEENRMALMQHLKDMEHLEFMPLLQKVYKRFLALVQGVQTQNDVINRLYESLLNSGPLKNSPSIKTAPRNLSEDLSDLLSSTTELSHATASKFLHARMEPHSTLSLSHFLALHSDSMAFVVQCEVMCRRMIVGLRGVVVRQAYLFLGKFHQGRIEKCARVVLDEMWNQVEVGTDIQGIVDVLVGSAVKDAEELKVDAEGTVFADANSGTTVNGVGPHRKESNLSSPSSPKPLSKSPKLRALPPTKTFRELTGTDTLPPSDSRESAKSSGSTKGSTKHLRIEDRSYYIVSATAEVLVLLIDYLKIVINLSTLTKDTINKVVEFLMTFNSRTCQLVLGAGAMRSAGLKHITAKHLALASQSLSVVSELIPYVRETFRRHLNQTEAVLLVDFDKLKRDYQVHQTEIHAKLISIMGDRLSAHIESLQAINWSQPSDSGVNDYMKILVKETLTLHKVLSRYLSAAVVEYVMTEVFAGINLGLSDAYGKIELPHQDAKDRLLADAKFLHKELAGLKNVVAPMGMLETVVSEKQVPRATAPSSVPAPAPTRSSTLSANQRLRGLLSRSSSIINPPSKAVPIKSPPEILSMQNASASTDTLVLSSEAASASNLGLNMSTPSNLDRGLSASPLPSERVDSENTAAASASLPSKQNEHEVESPTG